jgi:outer membrane lipoprotein LolB
MNPASILARGLIALALLLPMLFSGCTTAPTSSTQVGRNPAELRVWAMDGKLGFRSPSKNGSAWVHWQQQNEIYQLQLTGPFGAGATRIEGGPDFAVLSQSGEPPLTAADGEALTARLFGWPFPVRHMTHWIKGLPAPKPAPMAESREQGNLTRLTQLDWTLEYSDYQTVDGWLLPGRIRGSWGDTSFILVIKSWTPAAP